MTAWHDRQPLSRRQVRNSQREAEADAVFSAARIQTEEAPFGNFASTLPEASDSGESDRFESDEAPTVSNTIVPGGRRAQRLAAESANQDEGSFRVREFRARDESLVADENEHNGSTPIFGSPARPSMPEGLPSALAFLPSATVPVADETQAAEERAPASDEAASTTAESAVVEPISDVEVPAGRPLTRRELRALEAAREAADTEADPAEAGPSFAPPILFTPAADVTVTDAPAADVDTVDYSPAAATIFDAPVLGSPVFTVPAPEAPAFESSAVEAPAFEAPAFETPAFETPAAEAPGFESSAFDASAFDASSFSVETSAFGQKFDLSAPPETPVVLGDLAPPTGVPLGTSPTELPTLADLLAPSEQPVVPQSSDAPSAFVPQFSLADYPAPTPIIDAIASDRGVDVIPAPHSAPVGHWTMQQAIDDVTQGGTSTTSRDLSTATGPITSNALVLPSIPDGADLSVPFATATGEVLITGSISLPSTLGTTGAHPARYDHSDLDAIIDAADRDDIEGDSAPVRAIRAVSTHTSPRDVISMSRKSEGNRLPIVLAITAGTMMVSVTVLVVVGFIFGTF